MQHGDFTDLAENYAQYRPGYSPFVLDAILSISERESRHRLTRELHCADVGAGTGIWSRQLALQGVRVSAVEPNKAMREAGQSQNGDLDIAWHAGAAEDTGLPANSCDMVCMASSFHWPDFNAAVREFDRILKAEGLFVALWNTRRYESNPLLVRIENFLHELVPDMQRVSSGRSEFCDSLTDHLYGCNEFSDVLYIEGRHTEKQTQNHYIGLWESVNDVRVQAGEERFEQFIGYIKSETSNIASIDAEYTTRAWIARKKSTEMKQTV